MINTSSHTINTQKSYIFEHIPTDYFINTHAHIKKKCKLYLSKQIKKPYVNYTLKKKKKFGCFIKQVYIKDILEVLEYFNYSMHMHIL